MVKAFKLNETTAGGVTVSVWQTLSVPPASQHYQFAVEVGAERDDDWVCIGGGGTAGNTSYGAGYGQYLTASFPSHDFKSWNVFSREHVWPNAISIFGYAIGMKINGLSKDELIQNLRLTKIDSPQVAHPDQSCLVEPGFLLIGGGFHVIDQPQYGGNLATASFPDSSISWRARSKDVQIPSPSVIRVFAIGISPEIMKPNLADPQHPTKFGKVYNSFSSSEQQNTPDAIPGLSIAKPLDGFAMCAGGAAAHFWTGLYLWALEPTTKSIPLTSQNPLQTMDPSDQSFTVKSMTHLQPDQGLITAYAMGIKFEPVSTSPPPPPPTCNSQVPVNSATSSSNQSTFPPSNAIDNNPVTKWMSSNSLNPFIRLDLGSLKSVCRVDITWADANTRYFFNISTSLDGTNFTYVYAGARMGSTLSPETYTFPDAQARHVRIAINQSTPGSANSIAQISEVVIYSSI